MAALPTDFLAQVIADVAALKGITDANNVVKENDATVTACANLAYIQICRHTKRTFHWGLRTDYYDEYTGPLLLRVVPVDTTQPYTVLVDGEELASSDIKIVRNRLVLYDDTKDNPGYPRYPNIEFTATAGIAKAETNLTLATALQMQTIANYHRRDTLGLAETAGEKGIARTPIDSGEIIESVRLVLEEQCYLGVGYSSDGD